MPDTSVPIDESTAVDDVRRVRDRLDREAEGDVRKHIANTNAKLKTLQAKLGIKIVSRQISSSPQS